MSKNHRRGGGESSGGAAHERWQAPSKADRLAAKREAAGQEAVATVPLSLEE